MKTLQLFAVVSLSGLFHPAAANVVARPVLSNCAKVHSDGRELTYRAISGWQRDKTTSQEIKLLLGLPTSINANQQGTEWYYKTDKASVRVQFNADRTLSAYQYWDEGSASAYKVAPQQVKALVAGTTETDLIRLVGDPSYVSVSAAGKQLYYRNLLTHSTLQVLVNEKIGLITNYLLLAEGTPKATVDAAKLTDVIQGKTTAGEVVDWFGEPTKRMVDKDKETWYYRTNTAQLTFMFTQDDQKVVKTYQYQQR